MVNWQDERKPLMTLQEIRGGIRLNGIVSGEAVEILSAKQAGNAVEIVFRKNDGSLSSQILYEKDMAGIQTEDGSLRWQFSGDANASKLAIEAYRI
jgi:hypothetical protein